MKKILLSLFLLTVLTLSACQQGPSQEQPVYVGLANTQTIIRIDINPSITFVLDEDDTVVAIIVNNEEAEIITADLILLGLKWEYALEAYLTAAQETGYLNVTRSDNQVTISLSSEGKADLDLFKMAVQNRVSAFLDREDIQGQITTTEKYFEDLEAIALENNVTVPQWILIQAVLRADETLSLEMALELTTEELQTILQSTYQDRMIQAQTLKEELRLIIKAEIEATMAAIESGELVPPRSYEELRALIREQFKNYRNAQNNGE
jgi:predicted transcriptional regulator